MPGAAITVNLRLLRDDAPFWLIILSFPGRLLHIYFIGFEGIFRVSDMEAFAPANWTPAFSHLYLQSLESLLLYEVFLAGQAALGQLRLNCQIVITVCMPVGRAWTCNLGEPNLPRSTAPFPWPGCHCINMSVGRLTSNNIVRCEQERGFFSMGCFLL